MSITLTNLQSKLLIEALLKLEIELKEFGSKETYKFLKIVELRHKLERECFVNA